MARITDGSSMLLMIRMAPLTLRTDQRIDFVDLLNKPRPVPPERLFIPLRFEDAGNGVIAAFLLPFTP